VSRPVHQDPPTRLSIVVLALCGAAGAVLGVAMLRVDSVVDAPAALRFDPLTARALTTGLATGLVVMVALVSWVRLYAIQASGEPSPMRVRPALLADRTVRNAMGLTLAASTCTIVVGRSIPGDGDASTVPHLSLAALVVLAVTVAVTAIVVVHAMGSRTDSNRLLAWLTDGCTQLIARTHPHLSRVAAHRDGDGSRPPAPTGPPDQVVAADRSGWVHHVAADRLLDRMPHEATVVLSARPGWFVNAGQPLASIWLGPGEADVALDPPDGFEGAVRTTVPLGADGDVASDPVEQLRAGIGLLVDVAEGALTETPPDVATAREVVLHLGVVLRELLLRDLPPSHRARDDRLLLLPPGPDVEDYLAAAFDRIRMAGGGSPEVTIALLATIRALIDDVARAGPAQRAVPLRNYAGMVLHTAEQHTTLRHDYRRIIERAHAWGLLEHAGWPPGAATPTR
jgi:uncharacterized membrane protein